MRIHSLHAPVNTYTHIEYMLRRVSSYSTCIHTYARTCNFLSLVPEPLLLHSLPSSLSACGLWLISHPTGPARTKQFSLACCWTSAVVPSSTEVRRRSAGTRGGRQGLDQERGGQGRPWPAGPRRRDTSKMHLDNERTQLRGCQNCTKCGKRERVRPGREQETPAEYQEANTCSR